MFARDFLYRLHSKWFKLSEETFSALHYGLIGFYELSIFIFLLGPYFGLQIVGGLFMAISVRCTLPSS